MSIYNAFPYTRLHALFRYKILTYFLRSPLVVPMLINQQRRLPNDRVDWWRAESPRVQCVARRRRWWRQLLCVARLKINPLLYLDVLVMVRRQDVLSKKLFLVIKTNALSKCKLVKFREG